MIVNMKFHYLIVFLINLKCALLFNLEVRIPVIKVGEKGSYFGYSVAEHRADDKFTPWLLVGAPLGQNLQPYTNRSGALFKCPLSTRQDDCQQVVTDGHRSLNDDKLWPPGNDELKDNQWLGVSVRSSSNDTHGGRAVVCAHRYVKMPTPGTRWGQGLCYTLTPDLNFDEEWEPCKGRSVQREHEEFGYCQAGTSSALAEDMMVLGTPGPYTWRGTVYVMSVDDNFLDRDKTKYYGPLSETHSPVQKYSYLGMAVTAGRYYGDHLSYAAGAPRSEGHGQVVIFTKNSNPMNVTQIISGEQFASSFGYELATADVNGDQKPDLLVAAPFYFNRDQGGAVYVYLNDYNKLPSNYSLRLTGKPESRFGFAIANLRDLNKDGCDDIAIGAPYEGNGVVYIYLGTRKGLSDKPAQIIQSEDLPSMIPFRTFGYSLSGGLDMDSNSYPDLVVGSYEDSAIVLLRARPIIDIKTIVHPEASLKNIDPSKPGCQKDPGSNLTCFTFESCASIGEGPLHLQIIYHIEAETFGGNRKFSRVFFGPDNTGRPNGVNRTIDMQRGKLHCQEETVYIKENTRDILSPIKFLLKYSLIQSDPDVPFVGAPLPSIDALPILNQTQAEMRFSASFQKDCGSNDMCESNLKLKTKLLLHPDGTGMNDYQLKLGESNDLRLHVNLENYGESAYEPQLFITHPQGIDYISSIIKDNANVICNFFNKTLVVCNLGNPFKRGSNTEVVLKFDPKKLDDSINQLIFTIFSNSTSLEIDPQKPQKLTARVVKVAQLSISGSARPEQVFYGGEIVGESAMKYLDEVGSRVLHTYLVYNEGPWKAPKMEVHIQWPYQVANDKPLGKWLLYLEDKPVVEPAGRGECFLLDSQVNPLSLEHRPGLDEAPLEALTDPGLRTFESNLTGNSMESVRRRRDTEMVVRAEAYTDKDGQKKEVVNMNCKQGTAKCFKFTCVIYGLQRNQEATILLRGRLWNSTFVEDYPRVDWVRIASTARIEIAANYSVIQDTKDDEATVETLAYKDLLDKQETGEVPLWIIIVSVAAGILLLVIITLLLWKFGFFKRRRPDPTLSGNIEKHHEESPFLH